MTVRRLAIQLENSMASINLATQEVIAWLDTVEAPNDFQYLASLTLEEIALNCIKYGYDDNARHTIEAEWSVDAGQFRMTLRDDGRPFNPLEAPPPDFSLSLEDRPPGGLGLFMLRELWSHIEYERRDGLNCMSFTKTLDGEAS